jgi:hypothetical protein
VFIVSRKEITTWNRKEDYFNINMNIDININV